MHHPAARPPLRALILLVAGLVGVVGSLLATPVPAPAAAPAGTVAAADGGTIATTLVPAANRFPTGTGPQRLISRDCGHSVEVPGGRSLWLFCDTGIHDDITGPAPAYTSTVSFVPSGTAGLARTETDPTPTDPVRLTEAAFPARPKAFIVSGNTYGPNATTIPCSGGRKAFAWTQSLVTLPGTSTVLAFYQDHCPDLASGFAPYDIGVGEVVLPDVAAGDVSGGNRVAVTRRYDSIQLNATPGQVHETSYAQGAVVDGAYIYLYGVRPAIIDCSGGTCRTVRAGKVELARVTWADGGYRTPAKYRYYTGSSWSADEADAANILPDTSTPAGDGISVRWQPEIGRYVMIHSDTSLGTAVGPDVRTSPTPWGPWSNPVTVAPDASSAHGYPNAGCARPVSCRAYKLHPQLSGSDDLWFGYVREGDLASADGQPATVGGGDGMTVRLGSVPFSTLPVMPTPGAVTPGTPTGVTAAAGDGRATVSWTAPAPRANGGVIGYKVTPYRGSTALNPIASSGTGTSLVVPGLDNTQPYSFTVTAISPAGPGSPSARSVAVTPTGAPRAPTAVTAVSGDGEVALSWTAPTNTGGSPITGYRVTPYVDGVAHTTRVLSSPATSKDIGSLTNGTTYTFTVQAVTALGTSAESAPTAPVEPYGPPGAPTDVTVTPQNGAVALTWDAPTSDGGSPITGYRVTPYVGATAQPAKVLTTTVQNTIVSGLANGTTYTFRVHATNARGDGTGSAASAAVTPRRTAAAPTGLAAVAGDRQATVSWVPPTDTGGAPITGYRVTPFVDGTYLPARDFPTPQTTQVITGLANGTNHAFVVRAITEAGIGAASAFSPGVTPRTTPGAPTGITATAGNGQVTLKFTAPSNTGGASVTGYRITPYIGSIAQPARQVSFATTHVVSGLANGTSYTFALQAVNAAGAGPVATSPVARPRTLPGAPGLAVAVPGDRSATLVWTPPASTGGAPVTGYVVVPYVGGQAQTPRTFTSSAVTQVVTGLTNGTSYRFIVRAVNEAGTGASTDFSNSVTPIGGVVPPPGYAPYDSWADLVDGVTRAVIGRGSTASERADWVARLSSGEDTPGDLVVALRATSDQVKLVDPVSRLYRAYFLRSPDAGGLDYWVSQRRAGRSLYWISEAFARSAEFTRTYGSLSNAAFMDLVYRQVLEREPEPAGHAYWTEELRSGRKTRGMVMVGFSEAGEYKTRNGPAIEASVAHLRFFGRAPSDDELEVWVDRRRGGTLAETLYDAVVDHPEHAARVG